MGIFFVRVYFSFDQFVLHRHSDCETFIVLAAVDVCWRKTERSGSVTEGALTVHRHTLQSITPNYMHPLCVFLFPCAPTQTLIVLTGTSVQGALPPNPASAGEAVIEKKDG